ncbi:MAG: PAS domain S-box protein [Pseudodesulfovibrio sp.]
MSTSSEKTKDLLIEELATAKHHYKTLSDAAFEAIFISEKGVCLGQNKAARDMFGFSDEEAIGRMGAEWIHPDYRDIVMNNMLSGYGEPYEVFALRKDGSTFPCEIRGNMANDQGRSTRTTVLRNISGRRQAEDALLFKASIIESSSSIIATCDLDGHLTYGNPQFLSSFGFTVPEELLGKDFTKYWLLGDQQEQIMTTILQEGSWTGELKAARQDGTLFDVHVSATKIVDNNGDPIGLTSTTLDITEHKRAKRALKASERRFRSLLENVDMVAVQGYNMNREVIYWNRASQELYGYSQEEAMGQRLEELIIPEPMKPEVIRLTTNWINNGESIPPGELDLVRKDGSLIPVYSSHVMQESTDGIKTMYCIDIELSDIRQANVQLRQSKEEAEAANQSKSIFLANMSHEIRTPLNGILGMLQLMETTTLNDDQTEYTETAIQSTIRLSSLLSDILDLSKVEAGKLTIQAAAFDLEKAIRDIADLYEITAKQSGVELHYQTDKAVPQYVVGDILRVQQLLTNLVGNAFKFTDSGNIAIEVSLLPELHEESCRILFSITDTGIGIPGELQDTLFDPFTQASEGSTRSFQGAGLGLAISKELVLLMGGNMVIDSTPGKGTAVYISLPFPIALAPSKREMNTTGRQKISTEPLKILLAEDDKVSSLLVQRRLEKLGHQVTTAPNGLAALNELRLAEFDLILMDVQMPVMGGMEATSSIRNGELGKGKANVPIIALTACAMSGDKEKFIQAGMNGYLAKPVDLNDLLGVMDAAIKL